VRQKARVLLAVVACVLAVSLAAGTLSGAESPDRDGAPGSGDGAPVAGPGEHPSPESSNGMVRNPDINRTTTSGNYMPPVTGMCVSFLRSPLFVALTAVGATAAGYVVSRRLGRAAAALTLLVVVAFVLPLYGLFSQCGGSQSPPEAAVKTMKFATGETGKPVSDAAAATTRTLSLPVLVGVVGIALVVVAAAFLLRTDDDAADVTTSVEDEPSDDQPAGGDWTAAQAAAGDAADRIAAGADVDNEVYRAWRDMTEHVPLPAADTATPAEVADAARDAGVPAEHADALTDLFREVRYGDRAATADREQRAVDALRAIETDD
jgi:hypothetical protein